MPHPNAVKGAAWERWCAKYLRLRRSLHKGRHDDMGDLEGDNSFVYECKNDNSRSPAQWWSQGARAAVRAGKPWTIVLAKTACMTGKPKQPGEPEGWAQMSVEQWREIREYIRALESAAFFGHPDSVAALRRRIQADLSGLDDDTVPVSQRQAS